MGLVRTDIVNLSSSVKKENSYKTITVVIDTQCVKDCGPRNRTCDSTCAYEGRAWGHTVNHARPSSFFLNIVKN
jgi:hypothetical protein